MNIHVIANEKFTKMFIEFISSKYNSEENIVYVYNCEGDVNYKNSINIQCIDDLNQVKLKLLNGNGKLFIHAFYDRKIIRFLFKNIRKLKNNRLVLIAWGADIYDNQFLLQDGKLHLKTRFYEFLKKRIIKSCNLFMTFACADYDVIKHNYGGKGIQFDCLYPSNADIALLDKLKQKKSSIDKFRILLGNSATETNQHKEVLDMLSRFKNREIEIICPLSYGDTAYASNIISYGVQLFGNKFIPITKYMSINEYCELLNSVDIAVFNHNRQQGTGNIEILAYLGKKIFLRSDTTTWKHYVERDHCIFFDTKNIPYLSFNEFVNINPDLLVVNELYFRKIWDINYIKSLWDKVLYY